MSFESWKEEFYPVDAETVPKERALEHSIQKWKGYLRENLLKHDLTLEQMIEHDLTVNPLFASTRSCALCWHHYDTGRYSNICSGCPLFKSGNGCLEDIYENGDFVSESIYSQVEDNPCEETIQALIDALEYARNF